MHKRRRIASFLLVLLKITISILLLAALVHWGRIDLHTLSAVADIPGTVIAAGGLVLLTLPLAALRWSIVLRLLGTPLPFRPLFHMLAMATLSAQFLFGVVSGDAIRGVYAWRALRGRSTRIAISIFADRLLGLLALFAIASIFSGLRLKRMQEVPQLAALEVSLTVGLGVAFIGGLAILVTPNLLAKLQLRFSRYRRVDLRLRQAREVLIVFRRNPLALAGAFTLSLLSQFASNLALVLLAIGLNIGSLSVIDYMLAAPLAFVANALPLSPGGLGVGEAAFDQICNWLDPVSTGVAYASIFFAYRAVSTVVLLIGLVSFTIYRTDDPPISDK